MGLTQTENQMKVLSEEELLWLQSGSVIARFVLGRPRYRDVPRS
jgi:hypothetical protein